MEYRKHFPLNRLTQAAPAAEVVTGAEVAAWIGLDADDAGALSVCTTVANVAREQAERWTRRAFVNRSITATYDYLPGAYDVPSFEGMRDGPITGQCARYAELLKPPLVSVDSLTWYLQDGSADTSWTEGTEYLVDASSPDVLGRFVLRDGVTPPTVLRQAGGLEIVYTAGYGATADSVPYSLRHGVLMLAAYLYEHRGDCGDASGALIEKSGAAGLLKPYRIVRV